MWAYFSEPERVQAREIILEIYHDFVVKGGRNSSRRIHFGQDLVDAVRELHLAWEAAKEVLGLSHTIFNKFDNKGRNRPRNPESAPMKAIKALADLLMQKAFPCRRHAESISECRRNFW